jgi:hypothetical protein
VYSAEEQAATKGRSGFKSSRQTGNGTGVVRRGCQSVVVRNKNVNIGPPAALGYGSNSCRLPVCFALNDTSHVDCVWHQRSLSTRNIQPSLGLSHLDSRSRSKPRELAKATKLRATLFIIYEKSSIGAFGSVTLPLFTAGLTVKLMAFFHRLYVTLLQALRYRPPAEQLIGGAR